MTPEVAKRLAIAYPNLSIPNTGVVGVAGVADVSGYARKPQQLRQLHPLRLEVEASGKAKIKGVARCVAAMLEAETDAIEERAAIVFETCPAPYANTFARLNHQKPIAVSEAEWRQALDDAGRLLDDWGGEAAAMEWTASDLFDVPCEGRAGGLVWQLKGDRVEALGADHVRLSDGRVILRSETSQ